MLYREFDIKRQPFYILWMCLTILNISCAQSPNSDDALMTTSIKYIQENKLDLLVASFSDLSQQRQDSVKLIPLLNNLHKILTEYRIPNWSNQLPSSQINSGASITYTIRNYEYRLSTKIYELGDSIVLLKISVLENRLYAIDYKKIPPKIILLEPPKTDHQNLFDLKLEDLNEFRFYYEPGNANIDSARNKSYYAVSGGYNKLTKCELISSFNQLFNLLNESKFDSTDYKLMISYTRGDSEFFYLRFNMNKGPYIKLGDFEIVTCLTNEIGVNEELMDYVILIHSKTTRYFIRKTDNIELALLLEEMAHTDYGKCKE
jgi:hypothetical protein